MINKKLCTISLPLGTFNTFFRKINSIFLEFNTADNVKNNLLLLNVFVFGASDFVIGCASQGRGKGTLNRVMFIWARGGILKFHCSLNGIFNEVIDAERASAVMCVGNYPPTKKPTPYNHDLTIMFASVSANPQ